MVICLDRGSDLHMAQLMPLPLTVCCFSKIQIGFAFLVPAHPGSPGKRAVKCVCACVCLRVCVCVSATTTAGSPCYPYLAKSWPVSFSTVQHVNDYNILPESQCGFRGGRSTMDMIFTARQLQEKCCEQQQELYAVFVDRRRPLTRSTGQPFGKSC